MRHYLRYSIRFKLTVAILAPLIAAMLISWIIGISVLHLGLPEQQYLELHTRINIVFTIILFFAVAIGGTISAWLGNRLSQPIKELEEAARRIALGEYLSDIVLGSHDELAVLAEEFNIMKHRLIERESENLALNWNLEEKVRERTVELEEKNQWLLLAQQELARAERLVGIGLLASGVAHEINNPLAIIRGNAELLDMSRHLGDSEKSEIETIFKQVGRVERIVSNLLSFARAKQLVVRSFSLTQLLDDILDQLGHQMALDIYCITRKYLTVNCTMEGDEDLLRQVFTNLIVNALQAMQSGGILLLDITIPEVGDYCCVTVSDNGNGIDREQQEKLFSPFYTTKPHGTGLGLAISYGIVKDHGGEIRVNSEPGAGSTFTVHLPLRQTPGAEL